MISVYPRPLAWSRFIINIRQVCQANFICTALHTEAQIVLSQIPSLEYMFYQVSGHIRLICFIKRLYLWPLVAFFMVKLLNPNSCKLRFHMARFVHNYSQLNFRESPNSLHMRSNGQSCAGLLLCQAGRYDREAIYQKCLGQLSVKNLSSGNWLFSESAIEV